MASEFLTNTTRGFATGLCALSMLFTDGWMNAAVLFFRISACILGLFLLIVENFLKSTEDIKKIF